MAWYRCGYECAMYLYPSVVWLFLSVCVGMSVYVFGLVSSAFQAVIEKWLYTFIPRDCLIVLNGEILNPNKIVGHPPPPISPPPRKVEQTFP